MGTKAKKRRGRPPKSSGRTKSESVLLRLQPAEKEAFSEASGLAGISLSAWIRERLRSVAARELESASRPVAFLNFDDEA